SNPMRRVTLSGSKLGPVSVRLERIEVGMARYTDSLMFRPVGFTRVEIVSLPGLLRPWQVDLMRLACGEAEPRYQGGLHRPLRRERQLDASDRQGCADRGIADPRYQRNAARFRTPCGTASDEPRDLALANRLASESYPCTASGRVSSCAR